MSNHRKVPLYPLLLRTREFVFDGAARLGFGVASYRQPSRAGSLRRVLDIKKRREMLLTPIEAEQIFSLVRATSKLGGSMAEVGVYRGASARMIREADKVRPFHLFDTFEGLPEPGEGDTVHRAGRFEKGQFACSLDDVKQYLRDTNDVYFHQGLFPDTGKTVGDQQFSFVHSDVDIYDSTRGVLEFFYPRLLPGGVLISHDFACADGVRKAFVEFFADLPEPIIELPGDQAMIMKIQGVTT